MPRRRIRILLAVEPRIFGSALQHLLDDGGAEVALQDAGSTLADDHFDVAVVTGPLPQGVSADRIICLPDVTGHSGMGAVIDLRGTAPVRIDSADDVLALLE